MEAQKFEGKIENTEVKANPEALTDLAHRAKVDTGGGQFMNPGEKVKRGRGRPKGAPKAEKSTDTEAAEAAVQAIPTKDVVKPLVQLVSNLGVGFVGDPRAAMKVEELEAGATALGLVIDKYMPQAITNYGPEIMCCMVFGQYGLRLMAMKKVLELDRIEKEKQFSQMPQENKPQQNPISTMVN